MNTATSIVCIDRTETWQFRFKGTRYRLKCSQGWNPYDKRLTTPLVVPDTVEVYDILTPGEPGMWIELEDPHESREAVHAFLYEMDWLPEFPPTRSEQEDAAGEERMQAEFDERSGP